jgi:hypothetical protein
MNKYNNHTYPCVHIGVVRLRIDLNVEVMVIAKNIFQAFKILENIYGKNNVSFIYKLVSS